MSSSSCWFRCTLCHIYVPSLTRIWAHLWMTHGTITNSKSDIPAPNDQWEAVGDIRAATAAHIPLKNMTTRDIEEERERLRRSAEEWALGLEELDEWALGDDELEESGGTLEPHPQESPQISAAEKPKANKTKSKKAERILQCEVCRRIFETPRQLSNHRYKNHKHTRRKRKKKVVVNTEVFSCNVCQASFTARKLLLNHQWELRHEPDLEQQSSYVCDHEGCGATLRTVKTLELHKCIHHPLWKTMKVREKLNFKSDRMEAIGCKVYPCPHCPVKVVFKWLLPRHLQKHSNVRPFACTKCESSYKTEDMLKRHKEQKKCGLRLLEKMERTHQCDICNSFLKSERGLVNHKKDLHGITRSKEKKDYSCLFCGYKAAGPHALTLHNRIHTGEKPYTCEGCGRGFAAKHNMWQHARMYCPEFKAKGLEIEEDRIRPVFNFSVAEDAEPFDGSRVTMEKKEFKCPECSLTFPSQSRFRYHTKGHGDVVKCTLCASGFNALGPLSTHYQAVHGKKLWGVPCHLCQRMICADNNLQRHYLAFHAQEPPPLKELGEMAQKRRQEEEERGGLGGEGEGSRPRESSTVEEDVVVVKSEELVMEETEEYGESEEEEEEEEDVVLMEEMGEEEIEEESEGEEDEEEEEGSSGYSMSISEIDGDSVTVTVVLP